MDGPVASLLVANPVASLVNSVIPASTVLDLKSLSNNGP